MLESACTCDGNDFYCKRIAVYNKGKFKNGYTIHRPMRKIESTNHDRYRRGFNPLRCVIIIIIICYNYFRV